MATVMYSTIKTNCLLCGASVNAGKLHACQPEAGNDPLGDARQVAGRNTHGEGEIARIGSNEQKWTGDRVTTRTIAVTYTLVVSVYDEPEVDINARAIEVFRRYEQELVPSDTRDIEVIA